MLLTPLFLLVLRSECGWTAWVASLVYNTALAVYTQARSCALSAQHS